MNLKVVEKDLISSECSQHLEPLGQSDAQIVLGKVQTLHTNGKLLLLLPLFWLVVGDPQVVGGFITFLLHNGH